MEVIPVLLTDQPNPIGNLRIQNFFIVSARLDNDVLRNALDQLIRQHWRKLGARLALSPKKAKYLEYRLPKVFPDDHTLFNWSSEYNSQAI
jgi:hypothetical protein